MTQPKNLIIDSEMGGHEIRWHGTVTPGDPGTWSDPEEEDEVEIARADLCVGLIGGKPAFLDILDLVEELAGGIPQEVIEAFLDAASDEGDAE